MARSPDQQLINFVMSRATARRVLDAANARGLSRSALLRRMIMDFLHETEQTDG